jgi:hypothetical protein
MLNLNTLNRAAMVGAAALALGAMTGTAGADETDEHGAYVTRLLMPIMSSSRGMELFVEKGCYSCHSVNGIGGEDAAALDAHDMEPYMNPFDLAAKMWTMAPYMIPAQEDELGAQIQFTGDELADIIAFLHDDDQQHRFTETSLSAEQLAGMHHMDGEPDGGGHDEAAEPDGDGHVDNDGDSDDPSEG